MVDILQDPISRVYTVISILMLLVSGILAVNHNLAQEALLAAKTSRPFPYTSQMAAVDSTEHILLHREDLNREREFLNARLETIVQSFKTLLRSLEIPPPEVKDRLRDVDQQIRALQLECAMATQKLNQQNGYKRVGDEPAE